MCSVLLNCIEMACVVLQIEPKHGKFSKQQDSNQEAAVSHSLDSLDSTPSTKQSKNSAKRNQKKARQVGTLVP